MCIRHMCGNPACCNPEHLKLGTSQENAQDRDDHDRTHRGEAHHLAKLTESIVRDIRARATYRGCYSDWAAEFGVTKSAIRKAANGLTWRTA